jgi:hypothetical protein
MRSLSFRDVGWPRPGMIASWWTIINTQRPTQSPGVRMPGGAIMSHPRPTSGRRTPPTRQPGTGQPLVALDILYGMPSRGAFKANLGLGIRRLAINYRRASIVFASFPTRSIHETRYCTCSLCTLGTVPDLVGVLILSSHVGTWTGLCRLCGLPNNGDCSCANAAPRWKANLEAASNPTPNGNRRSALS